MQAAYKSLQWVSTELGIDTVLNSSSDTRLVLTIRFLRMFGYGSTALILALYFSALGHSDRQIGLFMTLTLAGDVAISLLLTLVADALGRRRILFLGAVLIAGSGAVFALSSNYIILLMAAIVGVISPSGNEIGPFRTVEESTLAQLSDFSARPDVFAWYVVMAALGTATGSLSSGWLVQQLHAVHGWTRLAAYRAVFWMYTATGLIEACLTLCLSQHCEVQVEDSFAGNEREPLLESQTVHPSPEIMNEAAGRKKLLVSPQISRKTWSVVFKLCAIFAVDSVASGMVPFSLITYYIDRKFNTHSGALGTVMSAGWFLSSASNVLSAPLVRRIGLIPAMVSTNLPAAVCLTLLPLPGSLALTIALILLRSALNGMDQAPRSAFISAVVLPAERTSVMGILMTLKTMAQSIGPSITGVLASKNLFWVAFVAAGILKVLYNIGCLGIFWTIEFRDQDTSSHADGEAESQNDDSRIPREENRTDTS